MNRPSFQFYPGDWQANSNLRRCSFEEKGIWLEVICLLHDQEEYGVSHWSLKDIAQAVGCTPAKLKGLVNKGILKGADAGESCPALVYTPRSGRKLGTPVELIAEQPGPVWYSSRMVTDEHKRLARGEGNDASKPTPKVAPKPPIGEDISEDFDAPKVAPKPPPDPSPFSCAQASRAAPSSSSSSSSSKEEQKKAPASPSFDPLAELAERGVTDQTAKDWLALRKSKKAIVTVTALKQIIAEADKAALPLERVLAISCRRGWIGFEAKWLREDDLIATPPTAEKDWI